MRWVDIEDIVEELEEKYPDQDLLLLKFTDLRKWVISLENFNDDPSRCNEKILENIQAKWIEWRGEKG
jgi:FeS assembly protein IscX